jgi:hypothetical protein
MGDGNTVGYWGTTSGAQGADEVRISGRLLWLTVNKPLISARLLTNRPPSAQCIEPNPLHSLTSSAYLRFFSIYNRFSDDIPLERGP